MSRQMKQLAMAIVLLAVAGCGSVCGVSGSVTYDGQPVDDGMITFYPADGQGPTSAAPIRAGRYSIDSLIPGPKLVEVTAVKQVPFARSSEEMAARAAAKAKGNATGIIDPADTIAADAPGNNTTVDVKSGLQELNFAIQRKAEKK